MSADDRSIVDLHPELGRLVNASISPGALEPDTRKWVRFLLKLYFDDKRLAYDIAQEESPSPDPSSTFRLYKTDFIVWLFTKSGWTRLPLVMGQCKGDFTQESFFAEAEQETYRDCQIYCSSAYAAINYCYGMGIVGKKLRLYVYNQPDTFRPMDNRPNRVDSRLWIDVFAEKSLLEFTTLMDRAISSHALEFAGSNIFEVPFPRPSQYGAPRTAPAIAASSRVLSNVQPSQSYSGERLISSVNTHSSPRSTQQEASIENLKENSYVVERTNQGVQAVKCKYQNVKCLLPIKREGSQWKLYWDHNFEWCNAFVNDEYLYIVLGTEAFLLEEVDEDE